MVHCDLTDRDIRLNRYSRSYAARIHYYPDRVPREPRLFTARKFKAQKATWLAHDPVGVEGQSLAVMTLAIIRTATTAVIDLAQWHSDPADISIADKLPLEKPRGWRYHVGDVYRAKSSQPFTSRPRKTRMHPLHREAHLIERIGWLRAAVLGANDGIISTSSLVVGVAAASTSPNEVIVAGVAGLVAGATAMAAGEYVSVSSQADTEAADLAKERRELAEQPDAELHELTNIYVERGLDLSLARQVAEALTAKDTFATHARDELGLSAHVVARPIQAALTSAVTFSFGAAIPLVIAIASPLPRIPWVVSGGSLVALAILGVAGAQTGGAGIWRPMLRVTFWGAIAMGTTAAIGRLVGHSL